VLSRPRVSATETCVVTPRLEFQQVVSCALDAGLEEHEEHASQLLFLPRNDVPLWGPATGQGRRANRNLTVYPPPPNRAYMTVHALGSPKLTQIGLI
jgi:hypothetical protein